MPNKWGIHWPNGVFGDVEGCLKLGVDNYTFLHHQAEYAYQMFLSSHSGHLHCRFYLPDWRAIDPVQWARECAIEYQKARRCPITNVVFSLQDLGVDVSPANEMNLVEEGGGASYQDYVDINRWLCVWYYEFVHLTKIAQERTQFPGFASGHSDDQDDNGYIGLDLCKQAVQLYGQLGVHVYWQVGYVDSIYGAPNSGLSGGDRFILTHNLYPDKPLAITECGNFAVTNYNTPLEIIHFFQKLYKHPYVLYATPFIYADPTGAHSHNDWSRNPEIKRMVTSWDKEEVNCPQMPINDNAFDRWCSDFYSRSIVPWNPDSAFCKEFKRLWKQDNIFLGKPQGPEYPFENTEYMAQEFSNGYLWCSKKDYIVHRSFPPFFQ